MTTNIENDHQYDRPIGPSRNPLAHRDIGLVALDAHLELQQFDDILPDLDDDGPTHAPDPNDISIGPLLPRNREVVDLTEERYSAMPHKFFGDEALEGGHLSSEHLQDAQDLLVAASLRNPTKVKQYLDGLPVPSDLRDELVGSTGRQTLAEAILDSEPDSFAEFLRWNRRYNTETASRMYYRTEAFVSKWSGPGEEAYGNNKELASIAWSYRGAVQTAAKRPGFPLRSEEIDERLSSISIEMGDPLIGIVQNKGATYHADSGRIFLYQPLTAGDGGTLKLTDAQNARATTFHELTHQLSGQTGVIVSEPLDPDDDESTGKTIVNVQKAGLTTHPSSIFSQELNESVTEELTQYLLAVDEYATATMMKSLGVKVTPKSPPSLRGKYPAMTSPSQRAYVSARERTSKLLANIPTSIVLGAFVENDPQNPVRDKALYNALADRYGYTGLIQLMQQTDTTEYALMLNKLAKTRRPKP